jgi:hypothetical protein
MLTPMTSTRTNTTLKMMMQRTAQMTVRTSVNLQLRPINMMLSQEWEPEPLALGGRGLARELSVFKGTWFSLYNSS